MTSLQPDQRDCASRSTLYELRSLWWGPLRTHGTAQATYHPRPLGGWSSVSMGGCLRVTRCGDAEMLAPANRGLTDTPPRWTRWAHIHVHRLLPAPASRCPTDTTQVDQMNTRYWEVLTKPRCRDPEMQAPANRGSTDTAPPMNQLQSIAGSKKPSH